MNIDNFYTKSEKTVRKYTVYQAIQSAKRRLKNDIPLCVNALRKGNRRLSDSDLITLKELNDLADEIYQDTIYYTYG